MLKNIFHKIFGNQHDKTMVEKKDITLKKCVVEHDGTTKTINSLVVNKEKRDQFFQKRPNLKSLLLRESTNPALEEGQYSQDKRDREGECYLTHEGLTLLLEKKLIQHKQKKNGLPYQKNNIFVVKNDEEKLSKILKNINLKSGEDIKLIIITGLHAVPVYIRNENNKIKCFIVDSYAGVGNKWPTHISNLIKSAYADPFIVLSSTLLQRDYYSCYIFSTKALMYFAKHGKEIFPYLEKSNCQAHAETGCHVLANNKLMPALLKMCQSDLTLSEETLNTIVSRKKNKTLKEYWEQYADVHDGKSRNTAALQKKYQFFDEVNTYMSSKIKKKKISSNAGESLPNPLLETHIKFSVVRR